MKNLNHFTNLYPLSKTLRFELIPQGETLIHIQKNGLLSQDEERAEKYKKVKKIIDEYHKAFISQALKDLRLDRLDEYLKNYPKKDDEQKDKVKEIELSLRKQISKKFRDNDAFKRIFKKELIKEDLIQWLACIPDLENWLIERNIDINIKDFVEDFKNFTTYFTGFHQNRENMYSEEEKSTAIVYRLVHQNLPKFVDNLNIFEKVKESPVAEKFEHLYKDIEGYLNVTKIEELFEIDYYSVMLTQEQIDVYNLVIGGKTIEKGKKVQGLNEYINLYNQKQTEKNKRLPKLKPLYKQILSDREAISWLPEEFERGKDGIVLESIEKFYQQLNENVINKEVQGEYSIKNLLKNLKEFDLEKIYLKNDLTLTEISQKYLGQWSVIQKAVEAFYEAENPKTSKETNEKYEEKKAKYFKSFDSFSLAFINNCLTLLGEQYNNLRLEKYFELLGSEENENSKSEDLLEQIANNYEKAKDLLNSDYSEEKDLAQEKDDVELIKQLLDSIKKLQWFIKPLLGKGNEAEKDERFYGELVKLWDVIDGINLLYNKVRNYMTQKPYSVEKFKLNFESSYLLSGWAQDYETKAGLLFVKDGQYYLGINNKKLIETEKKQLSNNWENSPAKRIILDFQKPDNKNIPRLFIRSKGASFAPAVNKYKLPISDIIDIYDSGKFKTEFRKKNEIEYYKCLHKLIDYFKLGFSKHDSYKHYSFKWKETNEYKDIAEFYNDVEVSCYKIIEENINWNELLSMVSQGKVYLFQIYNKDFSPHSKGTPNMHTLYWKMLFDPENLKNVVYKLNGQAEIFYRKFSIKKENITVHKANEILKNKNAHNEKKESRFDYDIIKDRRFTVDKFQFHVPITMNFKADGRNNMNPLVNEYLRENEEIHVIGIDRGERHLLYLTLIDLQGNIKAQFSLNDIINEYNGNTYKTNYHDLLQKREEARMKERESWKTIETIKELKDGYLSQVIHKISQLLVQYNAIVVLEDLNMGFMRGRQKVEKSVYQKFEKMLIDKLNYFVDKSKEINSLGGALNALQLTNKFESFQKMGKQSGFLFYVPAWNTSKMDPVTGFVNMFDTRYESIDKAKAFFEKFDSIRFNSKKNYFEFLLSNYTAFNPKAEGTRQEWIICTYGERIETFRNPDKNSQWDNVEIQLTEKCKDFFNEHNVQFDDGKCLKQQINMQTDKKFFEGLLKLLRLTLQMRNSITNSETDYLISPVANEKGDFFDSRMKLDYLPKDADANGAYNIARKGLWVLQQINKADDLTKMKLAISNKEWLQFAQNK